jgi:hypothetical protein
MFCLQTSYRNPCYNADYINAMSIVTLCGPSTLTAHTILLSHIIGGVACVSAEQWRYSKAKFLLPDFFNKTERLTEPLQHAQVESLH